MYIAFRLIVIPGLVHFCGMRTLKMALSTAIVASYWLVYCILKKHAPVVFSLALFPVQYLKAKWPTSQPEAPKTNSFMEQQLKFAKRCISLWQ